MNHWAFGFTAYVRPVILTVTYEINFFNVIFERFKFYSQSHQVNSQTSNKIQNSNIFNIDFTGNTVQTVSVRSLGSGAAYLTYCAFCERSIPLGTNVH